MLLSLTNIKIRLKKLFAIQKTTNAKAGHKIQNTFALIFIRVIHYSILILTK